jgi:hypothetical protein
VIVTKGLTARIGPLIAERRVELQGMGWEVHAIDNFAHELVTRCAQTILTSQLPVSRWHEQIGDPTLADSILDRLVHNAQRIEMRGDSKRKDRGKPRR